MRIKKKFKINIDTEIYEYYYPGLVHILFNGNINALVYIDKKPVYLDNVEIDDFNIPPYWKVKFSDDLICLGFIECFYDNFFEKLINSNKEALTIFQSKSDDNKLNSSGYYNLKSNLFITYLYKYNFDTSSNVISNIIHKDLVNDEKNFSYKISNYHDFFINNKKTYIDKSLGAKLNGNIEVGFFIHVEDGYLRKVEGYTFYEDWPENIESVEFFEITE